VDLECPEPDIFIELTDEIVTGGGRYVTQLIEFGVSEPDGGC
jgi:hypothetical protein